MASCQTVLRGPLSLAWAQHCRLPPWSAWRAHCPTRPHGSQPSRWVVHLINQRSYISSRCVAGSLCSACVLRPRWCVIARASEFALVRQSHLRPPLAIDSLCLQASQDPFAPKPVAARSPRTAAAYPPMQDADLQRYKAMFGQMDRDRDGVVQVSTKHSREALDLLLCLPFLCIWTILEGLASAERSLL